MKKNHFFIGYYGNKRQECETIYNNIPDITKFKTIIEPFCGSCAISYYISLKHPKVFNYVLNDNNKYLIELLKTAKDKDKLNELIINLNKKIINIDKDKYNMIIKEDTLEAFLIKNRIYCIRPGFFPTKRKTNIDFSYLENCPIINFLRNENITILNDDGLKIYNTYCNDIDNLIFLDPPYINSCNSFYINPNINIYEYLCNNTITKNKSTIILILEAIWIIKMLFKNCIMIEYDKKYETKQRKTKHILIKNK
jgi:site-specific DNA-adenine methylase